MYLVLAILLLKLSIDAVLKMEMLLVPKYAPTPTHRVCI